MTGFSKIVRYRAQVGEFSGTQKPGGGRQEIKELQYVVFRERMLTQMADG